MSLRDALNLFSGSLAENSRSKQTKLYSVAVVFTVVGFMLVRGRISTSRLLGRTKARLKCIGRAHSDHKRPSVSAKALEPIRCQRGSALPLSSPHQLRQLGEVDCHAPRLVAGEQIGRRSGARDSFS